MSEEELESLITLDDPGEDDLKEDTFNHSQDGIGYRSPGQPLPSRRRPDQRTEVIVDNDSSKLAG